MGYWVGHVRDLRMLGRLLTSLFTDAKGDENFPDDDAKLLVEVSCE